jgi:hypothetical protein
MSPPGISPPGISSPRISPGLRIRRKQERKNDEGHRRRSDKDAGGCPPATSKHYASSETHFWTLRGFEVQDFTTQKGRSFPLRALVAGSIRYLKVSPWPGRFAILNRNRAKDYGITVPSSNFFGDGGSAWHAKLGQWPDSRFRRALYPAPFDCGREPPPNSADRSEAIIAARG